MNDHDRIVRLEERLKSNRRARRLQAKEYERRLAELNHENARLLARDAIFLPREVFDGYVTEAAAREQLRTEALRLARSQRITTVAFSIIAAAGVVVALVALLIK